MVWVLSMRIDVDASRSVKSTNTKVQRQKYRGIITLQSVKGVLVDSVVAC